MGNSNEAARKAKYLETIRSLRDYVEKNNEVDETKNKRLIKLELADIATSFVALESLSDQQVSNPY